MTPGMFRALLDDAAHTDGVAVDRRHESPDGALSAYVYSPRRRANGGWARYAWLRLDAQGEVTAVRVDHEADAVVPYPIDGTPEAVREALRALAAWAREAT